VDSFNTPPVPITSDSPDRPFPSLAEFVESLEFTGQEHIVGVYVPGQLALRVVQQPLQELGFVSYLPNVLTQFKLASDYGSYGFLAHDHLVGTTFFEFEIGQHVVLIDGTGIIQTYIITDFLSVQALSPQSPYSQFRSLEFPWNEISTVDLFNRIYAVENRVILQTCISLENQPDWGRFFIIAMPYLDRYGISSLINTENSMTRHEPEYSVDHRKGSEY
jgi:hypothetical protein